MKILSEAYGLEDSWIPIGHKGGNEYCRRVSYPLQFSLKYVRGYAVAAIGPWDVRQLGRLGNMLFPEFPGSVPAPKGSFRETCLLHVRVV